jgi:rhamnulokinase
MLNMLAFDYGASSGRAIVGEYDGYLLKLGEVHRFANEPVMANGTLYWDILRLYHEMKQGIGKCVKSGFTDIASIGIDTWGVDFGLLDSAGRLLGNPVHYRDTFTEGMMEEAFGIISRKELYERTGIQLMEINTLFQLLAMKRKTIANLDKADTLLFIPDLLRYFLTGEKSTEYTIASTSQMLDAKSGGWAYEMLERFGIPVNMLSRIVNAGTMSGRLSEAVSAELGTARIPVAAVAEHDTASAVISVPALGDGYAYLSSGTWSLLGVETPSPVINDPTFRLNYTNEGGFGRNTRLLKNIMGLWLYQECKKEWDRAGGNDSFDVLEAGAAVAAPFTALIDPDDISFLRPGHMTDKIREYCLKTGQKPPETKPETVRCILESLALKYRMAIEGLEEILGYRLTVLHIVGGGCKNTVLSQFTANAIGRPVFAGPIEATAVGNLITQLLALGEVRNLQEGRELVRRSFTVTEYLPTGTAQWDEAYGKFTRLKQSRQV